ncbi:hypothetical protein N9N28_15830 [Rubripirellula amarantea]|nr:hypothetical protein [Rubripirellula amarantea]
MGRDMRRDYPSPFRQQFHQQLAGQYRPPAVNDQCERQLLKEEAGVSIARDAKLMNFSTTNPF